MGHDHNTTTNNTITPKTKVPLYVVASCLGSVVWLTIYGTALYYNLAQKIDAAVSIQQAQAWIDDARDANRTTAPLVQWPRLPTKQSTAQSAVEAVLARKD